MHQVVKSLQEEISMFGGYKNRIADRVKSKKSGEMVTNLHQLDFDFDSGTVAVSYFIEDDKFPAATLTLAEFKNLLEFK